MLINKTKKEGVRLGNHTLCDEVGKTQASSYYYINCRGMQKILLTISIVAAQAYI